MPLYLVPKMIRNSLHEANIQLLGFTHVIRVALGGQAKSETDSYRIELIPYVQFDEICSRLRGTKRQYV